MGNNNWQTHDPWEDPSMLDPFELLGCTLRMYCPAFPESYEVFMGDEIVGYIWCRHSRLKAVCPDIGGLVVYERPLDESYGCFAPEERVKYLPEAVEACKEWHDKRPVN
jgi:hypothetical protein